MGLFIIMFEAALTSSRESDVSVSLSYTNLIQLRYTAACNFLERNGLLSIIRAHEAQDAGYVTSIYHIALYS
mgnify:CR=1 FL=1|jgi:hypothetical protein